jgi:hypothetical protein
MKYIIIFIQTWNILILSAHALSGTKFFPPAAPSTPAGLLIELAADCYQCPSPVPPDSRSQAYKSLLAAVAN